MLAALLLAASPALPRKDVLPPFDVELGFGLGGCGGCAATDPDAAFEIGVGVRPWRALQLFATGLTVQGDDNWSTWSMLEVRLWPLVGIDFPVQPYAAVGAAYGQFASTFEGGGIRTRWTGFAATGRLGASVSVSDLVSIRLSFGRQFGFGDDRCTASLAYYGTADCPEDVHGPPRAWSVLVSVAFSFG